MDMLGLSEDNKGASRASFHSHFQPYFLSLPLNPHRVCLSCPCDRVEGKKEGEIIVTCSKNSSPMAHHCAAVWGRPRSYLHILESLWSGSGPSLHGLFRSLIAVGAWIVTWPCTYTQVYYLCTHTCRKQATKTVANRADTLHGKSIVGL